LQEAEQEEQCLRNRFTQIKKTIEAVARLSIDPRPANDDQGAPPASPTAARLALLEFQQEALEDLHQQKRQIGRSLRQARRQRQELTEQAQRHATARQAREEDLRKSILIDLMPQESQPPAESRLVLEYFVPGARWAPAYTVRFDETMTRATLTIRALVCQQTGEDWLNAPITCTTAQPQPWVDLPQLHPIRIGPHRPAAPQNDWRPLPDELDDLYEPYDQAFEKPKQDSQSRSGNAFSMKLSDTGHNLESYPSDPMAETMVVAEASDSQITLQSTDGGSGLVDLTHDPGDTISGASLLSNMTEESNERPLLRPRNPDLDEEDSDDMEADADDSDAVEPGLDETQSLDAVARSIDREGHAPVSASRAVFSEAITGQILTRPSAHRGPAKAPSAVGPLRVQSNMLRYDRLRMPSASRNDRGRLRYTETSRLYLEHLEQQDLLVNFNVIATIQNAVETAKRAATREPPRCRFAETINGFDHAYPGQGPTDVPADGQFHAVALMHFETDAQVRYVTVPRQSPHVYREAELANGAEAALLAGPVDVMVAERFLVSTHMPHTGAGEKVSLGLGVVDSIQVDRQTHYQESSALMSSAMDLRHEIRIDLTNHLPHAIEVEVRERLPMPAEGDKKLKVTDGQVEPPWEPFQQESMPLTGGRRWRVGLEPNQKRTLRGQYVIHVSAKHEVAGGNRREG
ncbi:MAG: DUF4139 domain-containing protein, partial [Phycisphaeraceae bacterium]|nr:DUF4139 domain-containing protein [Phycisphaeraceae bacterium]